MSATAVNGSADDFTCPCCKGKVRLTMRRGKPRLEIVRLTKPEVRWEPPSVLAEREMRAVCDRRDMDFAQITGPRRDHATSAVRKEATIAARTAGVSYGVIGRLLNRAPDTVRTLYGARS